VKILDKYLLKTFLITFTTVFVILFFIFILQTVWVFISELAGKDLDFLLVLKFLLFAMPRIVPLVLPLSVLLASIMTFGSLAENYEFAAMKSAGISLQRAMKGLIVFIGVLSVVAFIFANNVIPFAEYKFINFRRNIAQRTPAMAIAEGQFSEIGNYTIKVDKKSGDKGNLLTGVIIHIKANNGEGNKTVIKAKSGELISSESSNTLKLVLHDGYYYEDIKPKNYEERNRIPFAKATFKKDIINIDLSKLNTNIDNGEIANTNNMLNVNELKYTLDSLNINYKKDVKSYSENITQRIYVNSLYANNAPNQSITSTPAPAEIQTDLLNGLEIGKKNEVLRAAISAIESTSFSIDSSKMELEEKAKNINGHWIALYEKFVIAFACILMFFIGAPLGAIIRKGGLGLPIVLAVAIFILFHFINTFGKKVAQENGITPFLGSWMSTIVLSPLAVTLTYRATRDIGGMISMETFFSPFVKLYYKLPFVKTSEETSEDQNEDSSPTGELAKQIKIVAAPKKQVAKNNSTLSIVKNITLFNNISLILYIAAIAAAIILLNTYTILLLISFIVALVLLFGFIYATQKNIRKLEKQLGNSFPEGTLVALLLGFPLFPLSYFLTRTTITEVRLSTKQ
jgi:lipopolysaccharide export system permease protein